MIENHRRGWRTCRSTGLIGILVLGALASSALGAGPALKRLDPPGAQRGTAFTLTLVGRHLEGAEIVSDLPGTFTPLTASGQGAAAGKAEEKRPFLVELPGETPVGLYTLRLRSPAGLSNALLFSVGALPEVSEEESRQPVHQALNNSVDGSQALQLPATVNGTLAGPDRDVYRFEGRKGQRLVIEVEARRAGSALDPVIRLLTAEKKQIAISNDTHGLGVDCRLDVSLPESGRYYLMVHDARFSEQEQNFYRLKIGEFAYAAGLFPLGGRRGEKVPVRLLGGNLRGSRELTVDLSRVGPAADFATVPVPGPPGSLPLLFAVADLPETMEPPGGAVAGLEPGTVVNGRIGKPGEVDRYRLAVSPGEEWMIRLEAGGLGTSRLYGRLTAYDAEGNRLASAGDDIPEIAVFSAVLRGLRTSSDPFLRVKVPEGVRELLVAVEDLVERGGPLFGYRLVARRQAADFVLSLGTPYINIPAEGTAAVEVNIQRRGYLGEIQLGIPDAGEDLVVEGGLVPTASLVQGERARADSGLLTVTARKGASPNQGELSVWGEAVLEDGTRLRRRARGPGLVTQVQSSRGTGRPDPNNRDDQSPFVAHWLGMELPAMVSRSGLAALKVEGPETIRLVQGMQTQLPWKFESAVPGLRPPERVVARSIGSREVNTRVGEVGAKYISEGWLRIGTTVGTPALKFNLVLSGPLDVDGAPATVYSRVMTVDVVPGYRLSLAGEGIGLTPGGGGELLGRVEREPAFKQPVSIRPENFPLGVSCPPLEVPADKDVFRVECRAEDSAAPGEYEFEITSSSMLAGREKEKVPYSIAPVRSKIVVSAGEDTARAIPIER
jgi:hypothetical protein